MGISLGGGKRGAIAEVNVVPLIDILLVLLVIFMVIHPQAQFGLPVDLPQQSAAGTTAAPGLVVVQVLGDGTLRINQDRVEWRDLQKRLEEIFRLRTSHIAYVRGAGSLEFGVIARTIDVMRESGISTVGLITSELANAR
ncbi:MAG TPA: biopolymer transporter ExbD [Candidatus Solibacter sp.]|nr:biopolymer transporter ExbD [Candidatus Solibacter sp.]